jgi:hypothetical protein
MEMQEVDLYSGDITSRSDTMLTEVKAEDEEYRPSPPCHPHQTRAQLRKKFPFRCATCNNQFPIKSQLEKHLVKHPDHSTNGPLPTIHCTKVAKKKEALRAQSGNRIRLTKHGYKTNPLKCPVCKNQFVNELTFQNHFIKNPSHQSGLHRTVQQPLPSYRETIFDQEVQDIDRALQDSCRSEDDFRGFKQPLPSTRERPFDFNKTRSLGHGLRES